MACHNLKVINQEMTEQIPRQPLAEFKAPSYVKMLDTNQSQSSSSQTMTSPTSGNVSQSKLSKQQMFESDLYFLEGMMQKFSQDLQEPLMQRRMALHMEDPLEELSEVYSEVKEMENNFKKVLEVCTFMIEKNKDLFKENDHLQKENTNLTQNNTLLTDANNVLHDEKSRINQMLLVTQEHGKEAEQINRSLQDELREKENLLKELEEQMMFDQSHEKLSRGSSYKVNHLDIQGLKNELDEKTKRLVEMEQMLEQQTMRFETEQTKTASLLLENKKLKQQKEEQINQIGEFELVLNEKDAELDNFEHEIELLKSEVQKSQLLKKQKSYSKTKDLLGSNPMIQAQIHLAKQKSMAPIKSVKRNSLQGIGDSNIKKQKTQMIGGVYIHQGLVRQGKNLNAIIVRNQMENFREIVRLQRKSSCPLVVVDQHSGKFQIYDKGFNQQKQRGQEVQETSVKPPTFYPYGDMEQVVVEAQNNNRIPQSLRYQSECLLRIGQYYQDALNKQTRNSPRKPTNDIQEQDDSDSESQSMESCSMENESKLDRTEGYQPISILQPGGLDINEEDFNEDSRGDRATLNPNALDDNEFIFSNFQSFNDREIKQSDSSIRETLKSNRQSLKKPQFPKYQKSARQSETISKQNASPDIQESSQSISKENKSFKKPQLIIETEDVQEDAQQSHDNQAQLRTQNPKQELSTPNFHNLALKDGPYTEAFLGQGDKDEHGESVTAKVGDESKAQNEERKHGVKRHQKYDTQDSSAVGATKAGDSFNQNHSSPKEHASQARASTANEGGSHGKHFSITSINVPPAISYHNSQSFTNQKLQKPLHLRGYSTNQEQVNKSPPRTYSHSHSGPKSDSANGGSENKSPQQHSRKDPNEEFFLMSLLAYKMCHQQYDKILAVRLPSSMQLFFYRWMELRCTSRQSRTTSLSSSGLSGLRNDQTGSTLTSFTAKRMLKTPLTKKREQALLFLTKLMQRDLFGTKLFSEYILDTNYFK